jgi:hypothetical protein
MEYYVMGAIGAAVAILLACAIALIVMTRRQRQRVDDLAKRYAAMEAFLTRPHPDEELHSVMSRRQPARRDGDQSVSRARRATDGEEEDDTRAAPRPDGSRRDISASYRADPPSGAGYRTAMMRGRGPSSSATGGNGGEAYIDGAPSISSSIRGVRAATRTDASDDDDGASSRFDAAYNGPGAVSGGVDAL